MLSFQILHVHFSTNAHYVIATEAIIVYHSCKNYEVILGAQAAEPELIIP